MRNPAWLIALALTASFWVASSCNSESSTDSLSLRMSLVGRVISVSPSIDTIEVNETTQLTAVAVNGRGKIAQHPVFIWTSSDASVATVSSTGLVTGMNAGTTEIGASAGGVSGSSGIVVTLANPPPPPPPPPPPITDISYNPAIRYQTVSGFGANQGVWENRHLLGLDGDGPGLDATEAQKLEMLDKLFSPTTGIGLSRIRMNPQGGGWQPIEGGAFHSPEGIWYAGIPEMVNEVKSIYPALTLTWTHAGDFPYDSWMTADKITESAEWMMTRLRMAKADGIEPQFIGILNEPTNGGCSICPRDGAYMRDATKALGLKLRAEGFSSMVTTTEDLNDDDTNLTASVVLADATARGYVGAVSSHLYGSGEKLPLSKGLANQYGLPLWSSEYYLSSGSLNGIGWALIVHSMLVDYNTAAVDHLALMIGRAMAPGPGNEALLIWEHSGTVFLGYTLTGHYYEFGQYSKYIRPGSQRIEASSAISQIKTSAFVGPDSKVVVVLINTDAASWNPTIPAGNWQMIRTQISGSDRLADQGVVTGSISLLPYSITTLVEQ
jgi:O-glycosyl hydrolase